MKIGPAATSSNTRRARRLSGVLAIVLSLASIVGVSPAGAATYHASLANVSATLTYQGTYPTPRHTMLTISLAGHVAYRETVSASLCGQLCWPTSAFGVENSSPLRVVSLRAGSPEVLLGLYSGGAHCCYIVQVFSLSPAKKYVKTEITLGDPIAGLQTLPGSPYAALVTEDDSFAYQFTDYAASGLPLKILRFSGHGFTDVTRQYPALLRPDAAGLLAAFYAQKSSHYSDSVGLIAAWAADEYLLGRVSAAKQFLNQQAHAGHLRGLLYPAVKGATFVAQLETFLTHQGY
ncbi:MAG: hypothetical protein HKL85_01795 [Acidimicrobiaceae bacterium]|nr:hypothetical protein [Acidimicrobiaceae bacterium]